MTRSFPTTVAAVFFAVLICAGPGAAESAKTPTPFDYEKVEKANPPAPAKTGSYLKSEAIEPASEGERYYQFRMIQEQHRFLESIILGLGLVSSLIIILRFITRTAYTAGNIVNASGLVLIIFGTIYIVILSDNDQQMTATMGILGAIAGYLFGTMERSRGRDERG